MQRIIRLVIKRPKLVFIALLLISVAAISQLGKLTINVDADELISVNDPNQAFYKITQETFGPDSISVVFIEDKALFTPKKIELLQTVTGQLESIEGVVKVTSLFSLKNFKPSADKLVATPFFENIPTTDAALEKVQRNAQRNPFARNVLSSDGTAMLFQLHARNSVAEKNFDARLIADIEQAIEPLKKEVIAFESSPLSFGRVFQTGSAYVRQMLAETMLVDQSVLIILAIFAFLASLIAHVRSLRGLLTPLLIAGISILWTLGFMAAIGLPMTILTAIIPVLIIVLGPIHYLQMLNHYRAGLRAGKAGNDALLHMASHLGLAFFLTFSVIFISFLLIILNDIRILQQFGTVAAAALLLNFVTTIILVPLSLLIFGTEQRNPQTKERTIADRFTDALVLAAQANKTAIFSIAVILSLAIGSGIFWIKINNNPRAFFIQESPVHSRDNSVAERLHGVQTFTIVFSAENNGAFTDPELLGEIKKVQDFIRQMKLVDTTLSIADMLSMLNREMNNGDNFYFQIPVSAELNQQYLSSVLSRSDIEQYVSADFKQATLRVWHHFSNSYQLSHTLERLQEFTDTLDKRLQVRFTGEGVLTSMAADAMRTGQIKSLAGLVLIIFMISSVLFMSLRAGLIALVPSLIPVFILFGLMGYLAIPLDIGTVMVAVICMGIAINHTLHFMIRYNDEVRVTSSEKLAMGRTIRAEIIPLLTLSISLFLGFAVLLAADLKPIAYFGGLAAILMLVALLTNLFITPKLLTSMRFVTLWNMVTVNIGREIIDNCPLFKDMHPWQIKQIILMSQVRDVQAGEVFIEQGMTDDKMFVILEGKARVEKVAIDGSTQLLNHPHEGDVIGELALISQQERMASVIAETDAKLLVLEWKALERLARFLPMISTRLFLNIARIIGQRIVN